MLGYHASYMAASCGDLDALKMLVEKDGDVIDLKGPNGETPLITASKKGYVGLCKYLLEEKKANINLKDNDGKTALQHAEDLRIIGILKKSAKLLKNKRKQNILDGSKMNSEKMKRI